MTTDERIHRTRLGGCTPQPLGSYLKALGVLRIVSEQADPSVRGAWTPEGFMLWSRLDESALQAFFLNDWRPNPFMSPWNKGSGLLTERDKAIAPLAASTATRFAAIREGIAAAHRLTEAMATAVREEKAIKDEKTRLKDAGAKARLDADPDYKRRLAAAARKCKELKDELQPICQRLWRGETLRWLRVAVVIKADGSAVFPSLLGTGGNDGKLDFTNNSMQRLGDLFDLASERGEPREAAAPALRSALFGSAERGLVSGGIGQYAPASSGGANASSGALGDSLLNPWDLPLLLEGSLLFAAGASRRLGGAATERTAAPFSANSGAAGYASAAASDEGSRGEQWMPLWSTPWTAGEVAALLQEGRCQLGARATESTLDVARAIARLGVARGVTAFERYGFLERNGKSNYAVPLGRWVVKAEHRAPLIDDLDRNEWWPRLRRAARDKQAPASIQRLDRALSDTVMAALGGGDQPARWQAVLLALADLEAQLVDSGSFTVKQRLQPIPPLSVDWLAAADDNSAEFRLARALAGAGAKTGGRRGPIDSVRGHWLPLDDFQRFSASEKGLANDPRVVVLGRDAEADLIRLVQRRLLDAEGRSGRELPLVAWPGTAAELPDLAALLDGGLHLGRTLRLARALAAVEWGRSERRALIRTAGTQSSGIDPAWAAFRLCHLPAAWSERQRFEPHIAVDPALIRLLSVGDSNRAFELARRRLHAAGIRTSISSIAVAPERTRRIAASLAFPISLPDAEALASGLDPQRTISAKE